MNDIDAAKSSKGRQNNELREYGEDKEAKEEEKIEEQDEKEVIVNDTKLQEQLDEIRTNMARNNGRLDDVVLNKLLNTYTCQFLYAQNFLISFRKKKKNDVHSGKISACVCVSEPLLTSLVASFPTLQSVL